jgi:type I restriction enzyme, R subunit
VVEAKADYSFASEGLQQAKQYAEILGLKFAYSTNGAEIVEFDYLTGMEKHLTDFPSPAQLWSRRQASQGIGEAVAEQRHIITPPVRARATIRKSLSFARNIFIKYATESELKFFSVSR